MPTVRELITKIAFRVEEGRLRAAGASVGRIKKQMRATRREAWKLTRNINGMAIGMKAMAAAFIGSQVLKVFTTGFSEGADSVAKFSKATGIASDFIQKFNHAMELGGATAQETQNGIKRFTRVVDDAQKGLKSAKEAFTDIGLDPKQIKADEAGLMQVADAFMRMEDGGTRAAKAQILFGKTGLKLIPGLKDGSKELKKYMDEAERLGIVLSKKQLADAEAFNDELLRAKSVFKGVRNEIATRLLPVITRNLVAFKEWATEGDNLARALDRVKKAAIATAVAFAAVKAVKIGVVFAAALPAIKTAALLLKGVAIAALSAIRPFLVWIALAAGLALAIEDLVRFAQGNKSLIGELFGDTAEGHEVKDLLLEIGAVFRGMRDSFKEVGFEILTSLKGITKSLGKIIIALLPVVLRVTIVLLRLVLLISKALAWAVDGLVRVFNQLFMEIDAAGKQLAWIGEKAAGVATSIAGYFTSAANVVQDMWEEAANDISLVWTWLAMGARAAGRAIAKPFLWAWKQIKKGWDFTVGKIVKAVEWIVDKITTATNALNALAGRQQVGPAGLGAVAAGANKLVQQQTTSVRVGSVPITIQGTANMTPAQLEAVANRAIKSAFSDFASDLVGNRRPLVEGAPG